MENVITVVDLCLNQKKNVLSISKVLAICAKLIMTAKNLTKQSGGGKNDSNNK